MGAPVPYTSAICLLALLAHASAVEHLPVVLWHGMGATTHTGGTPELKKLIEDRLGVYVFSITTGGSDAEQVYSGFFGNVTYQVESVCQLIQEKEELRGGYNAVGLSQGGLFMRAVIETCQHKGPRARRLITLGAPHQGIMNIPLCTRQPGETRWWQLYYWPCNAMQHFLDWGAYLPWIRDHVIQAQYFRDPFDLEGYLAKNPFLPEVNNELETKQSQFRSNLLDLEKLVLFRFDGDFTVVPRDSAWFSLADKDGLRPLNQTALYKEDYIGLKKLDESGRMDFRSFPGVHMQFSFDDFEKAILWPYLASQTSDYAQS